MNLILGELGHGSLPPSEALSIGQDTGVQGPRGLLTDRLTFLNRGDPGDHDPCLPGRETS